MTQDNEFLTNQDPIPSAGGQTAPTICALSDGQLAWLDLYDRLKEVHPQFAARAIEMLGVVVDVFERSPYRTKGQPGLTQTEIVHARHAYEHCRHWLQAVDREDTFGQSEENDLAKLDIGPGGDGLPHWSHAVARILLAQGDR